MHDTLVLKVAGGCNLSCRYCYARAQAMTAGAMMDLGLAREVLTQFVRDAAAQRLERITIIYHGGEPLMRGIAFFRDLLDLLSMVTPAGLGVTNVVQTNGVLLSEDWACLLRDSHTQVCVSVDGPPSIHDANRVDASGRGSSGRVGRGIACLRSAGVPFSVTATLTPQHLARAEELFQYFQQLAPTALSLELLWRGAGEPSLDAASMGVLLTELFDRWFDLEPRPWEVNLFQGVINLLMGRAEAPCVLKPRCAAHVACDHGGDLYPCDYYIGDRRWRIGNIRHVSFADVASSPVYEAFQRATRPAPECVACDYFDACGGGCSSMILAAFGELGLRDPYCEVRKTLIHHVARRLCEGAHRRPERGHDRDA